MTQTDETRGRITAEKLDELWEEFEASAKPTSFDGDMEFFNVEDMQDSAYYIYEAAKSLLAPTPQDARVTALVEAARRAATLMERHGLSGGLVADLQDALAAFDTTGGKDE